jgi:NAD-dependent deacetylase
LAIPKLLTAIRPILGFGLMNLHRPRVVLFGDAMAEPAWTLGQKAAKECDCLITIGTSGLVMPAALLPGMARSAGATIINVDLETTEADVNLSGPAATLLPALLKEAFG